METILTKTKNFHKFGGQKKICDSKVTQSETNLKSSNLWQMLMNIWASELFLPKFQKIVS